MRIGLPPAENFNALGGQCTDHLEFCYQVNSGFLLSGSELIAYRFAEIFRGDVSEVELLEILKIDSRIFGFH